MEMTQYSMKNDLDVFASSSWRDQKLNNQDKIVDLGLLENSNELHYDNPSDIKTSIFNKSIKSNSKKDVFNYFIDNRILYLKNLENLNPNWISGSSEIPNNISINNAVLLLNSIRHHINSFLNEFTNLPKIVIGPMPSGGITFDIIYSNVDALYLAFFNNEELEVDIKEDNFYYEREFSDISNLLIFVNQFIDELTI